MADVYQVAQTVMMYIGIAMEVYSGATQALYHHVRGPFTFKSSSLVV